MAQNGEVTNWILDSVGARWLYDFVRQHMPSVIVECGTSVGYSAIWLGEAAREYGGHVYSIEKDSVKYAQATMHIQEAGCENVTCLIGDAEDILKSWNGPDIDLLFLDANKKGYLPQFLVAEPYFAPLTAVIADNVIDMSYLVSEFVKYMNGRRDFDTKIESVGDGFLVARKAG